jgi:LacI family transcriptional regulator
VTRKSRTRRITIADVARVAGVSPTTVSLVLQDKGRISKKTRASVRRVMGELGYVYDRNAANLRKRSSRLVGLIVHDLSNPFFAELAAGVESVLGERGYLTVIGDSGEVHRRQREIMVAMGEHGVIGFVVCPAFDTQPEDLATVRASGTPCVLCVRDPHLAGYDFVGTDNFRGARLAMEHLIEAGHRRIAFVGGWKGTSPRTDRFAAYTALLEHMSIPVDEGLVVACAATREAGRESAVALIDAGARFTAALCYNDVVAFGFCVGLRERGLVAGDDVSVVGFDNLLESAAWTPPLTTVGMSPRTIGSESARVLLRRLEEPEATSVTVLLPPRFIPRQSTSAPR